MSTDTTEKTEPVVDVPARAGGTVLATGIRLLSALRRPAKPFHPHGTVLHGVVRRHGGERPSGVAWLDEAGEDEAVVRLSRAVGLPAPVPDIFGVAIRVPGAREGDTLTHREAGGAMGGASTGGDIPPSATRWLDERTASEHRLEGGGHKR